jgi:hypothetical protein
MKKWFGVTRRNCRRRRYGASICSKAYTEGAGPFELKTCDWIVRGVFSVGSFMLRASWKSSYANK